MTCPGCGRRNRADARFCDGCGAPLAPGAAGGEVAAGDRAERRQVSVVFCDLIGTTALSGDLDPEELRELLSAYQEAAQETVHRLGGRTAILLGDGILTYFGYPDAQEDDVERAVRAGLGIVDAVKALNAEKSARGLPSLAVRVAVHTGDVVVGELDATGAGIFGETPNVAARLQRLAPRNGVVVSEATHRLIRGLFRVEDLGSHPVEGVERPVRIYHVLAPSGVRSRFATTARRDTPLVGREEEAEVLWQGWREARDVGGRAILISGEPGIGKSRLVQAFHQRVAGSHHTWLECAGTPYIQHSAFAPVIQLQAEALRFTPGLPDADRLAVLERAVHRAELAHPGAVALLARLHSIEPPPGSPWAADLEGLTPDAVRRRTKEVARDWLLRVGLQQAVVLLVEDMHWVDPSTVELLGEILERLHETRALLIMTARPEFVPPWSEGGLSVLELPALPPDAAALLVRSAAGERDLPADRVAAIVAKTDGVPLFIEEMTRAALEAADEGTAPDGSQGVPATLKGLLMARIDRLGPARAVAQMAATIGREFSYDLIRAVWQDDGVRLDEALERLGEADLVARASAGGAPSYEFRHALIQETAYESLLKTTRRQYHARIGEVLRSHFPEAAETRPELLAHHFTQAQDLAQAIHFWDRAGQRSAQRSAHAEAERHLRSGLACVQRLPEGPERAVPELLFRTRLGANLITVRGYASEEVAENIARAEELCERLQGSPLIFPVLYFLWLYHLVRSDPAALRLADELQAAAERTDPERLATWGHIAQAITHYWQGRFAQARHHACLCREHYRFDPSFLPLFGDDPGAYGFVYQALPLWFLGYPEQGSRQMDAALRSADEIGYAFLKTGTRAFAAQLSHFSRDVERATRISEETIALAEEQGFPLFLATSLAHSGWAALQRGEADEGRARILQGVELYRSTGARLNLHYFQALIAEERLHAGDRAAGLDAVDEGARLAEEYLDSYFLPELHRLRGELLLLEPRDGPAAEAAFRQALDLAETRGAKMLELRAAVSAGRLLQAEGRPDEARERVGRLYGWFTEGLDDPDLADARRLLAELGGKD